MRKKMMAVLLATALGATMLGCGSKTETSAANGGNAEAADASKPIELTFAHIFPNNGNESKWLQWMADEVSARTEGGLKINLYADGQLGSESELTPQVVSGDIAFSLSEGSVWGDALKMPQLGIFGLPYICDSYDSMDIVGNEILPDVLNTMLDEAEAPLICMGPFSQGLRCVMTTEPAVRTAADMAGLKIRVPESSLYVNTMEAMGSAPTPIPSSELYSALSQGIVNAYENDPATVVSRNLHEVLKYYTYTNHFAALNVIMMNRDVFAALPEEYQTILKDTIAEACQKQLADRRVENEKNIKVMEEAGMEIITLPDSELELLKEKVAPMKEAFIKENGVEEIYADMLEKLEAAN